MPPVVTNLASTMCSFGLAPGTLMVLPAKMTTATNQPAGTITDIAPFVNIMPFGMCTSLANPTVAAATAAALGALTPMPCIPTPVGPWSPGATKVTIKNIPALTAGSICNCAYGGVITITSPGQMAVQAT